MNRCILLLFLLILITPAIAGRYNKVLKIGDQAPAWTDLPGTDDEKHSLKDLEQQEVIVVVITCNSCPYAMDVEPQLVALQNTYADRGVRVVAISVSKHEEDRLPAMKELAKDRGYNFPYLYDETQQIARDFGAKYTPEFYVLDQERRVAYMGAMHNSVFGKTASKQYVASAIDALLAQAKPKVAETAPVGCAIRYERVRRKRNAK
jgi:peroxiredoxin